MNTSDEITINKIKESDILFMTFGCATYLELENNIALSHAHGIKKDKYSIKVLTIYDLIDDITQLMEIIKKLNPNIKIILTVSPQRYNWILDEISSNDNSIVCNDQIVHSNQDKARLRTAIECIIPKFKNVFYFPSYDIVMDELRAYETFSNDINDNRHINSPATSNYVVNKFLNCFCSQEIKDILSFYREMIIGTRCTAGILTNMSKNVKNKQIIKDSISPILPKLLRTKSKLIAKKISNLLQSCDINLDFKELDTKYFANQHEISDFIDKNIFLIDEEIKEFSMYKVYVYGTGQTTTKLLEKSSMLMKKTEAFINTKATDSKYFSKNILALEKINFSDKIIIIIGSASNCDEIILNIKKYTSTAKVINIFKK